MAGGAWGCPGRCCADGGAPPLVLSSCCPQIRSDKRQPGGVIYSIQGPGVDEEPLGLFSVEKFSGRVFLNAELDREKTASYRVGTHPSPPQPSPAHLIPLRPVCEQATAFWPL